MDPLSVNGRDRRQDEAEHVPDSQSVQPASTLCCQVRTIKAHYGSPLIFGDRKCASDPFISHTRPRHHMTLPPSLPPPLSSPSSAYQLWPAATEQQQQPSRLGELVWDKDENSTTVQVWGGKIFLCCVGWMEIRYFSWRTAGWATAAWHCVGWAMVGPGSFLLSTKTQWETPALDGELLQSHTFLLHLYHQADNQDSHLLSTKKHQGFHSLNQKDILRRKGCLFF